MFTLAGKLQCLSTLLQGIIKGTKDRAVVVASSTAALDIVQGMCQGQGYTTCRIDGATPPAKRQDVVDAFNYHNVGQAGFQLAAPAMAPSEAASNAFAAKAPVCLESLLQPAVPPQCAA